MEEYLRRNLILAELGFKNYRAYLRSRLWKDIRAKKLKKDPKCYGCTKKAVQVHHSTYSEKVLTGATQVGLWSLCGRCHRWIEFDKNGGKRTPRTATSELLKIHNKYWNMHWKRARLKVDNPARRHYMFRRSG